MEWLFYLLEANLYLVIFYGLYRLLLHRETFYVLNRYYLIFTSILAFVIPVLQIGYLKPAPILVAQQTFLAQEVSLKTIQTAPVKLAVATPTNFSDYLYLFYIVIALCFAIKLAVNIFQIISLYKKANKQNAGFATLIELEEQATAFSFFNLLFIHPQMAKKETVLKHEMVHIKQKHSIDILFFELVQIICWFNPILYFLKKDIKLLHEYIADEQSTQNENQKHDYALFLIENSFGIVPQTLSNQIFNPSLLKQRISMLNKKRTAGWARLRLLLVLPLCGLMLCASTMAFTKDYGYVDLLPQKTKLNNVLPQDTIKVKALKKQAQVKVKGYKIDQVKFPPPIVKADVVVKGYKIKPVTKTPPKEDQVKFPPPIVKADVVVKGYKIKPVTKTPPKEDQVKFPTPIVKPPVGFKGNKKLKQQNPPKEDQVKFPPPAIKTKVSGVNKTGEGPVKEEAYFIGDSLVKSDRVWMVGTHKDSNGKNHITMLALWPDSDKIKIKKLKEVVATAYGKKKVKIN